MIISRQIGSPDAHGVVDVELEPDPRAGNSYLEGYLGPRDRVAEYASSDHVRIPQGSGRAAVLVKVRVDDEYRRRRLGTALVRDFVELCRGEHVDAVYLYAEVSEEGIDLVRWYESLGFKRLHADDCDDPEMVAHLAE